MMLDWDVWGSPIQTFPVINPDTLNQPAYPAERWILQDMFRTSPD